MKHVSSIYYKRHVCIYIYISVFSIYSACQHDRLLQSCDRRWLAWPTMNVWYVNEKTLGLQLFAQGLHPSPKGGFHSELQAFKSILKWHKVG